MDANGFDRLTRILGSGAPRRTMIKSAFALTAAAAATAMGWKSDAGAAARPRGAGVVCSKNADCLSGVCAGRDATGRRVCQCGAGETLCAGACVKLQSDDANCGACGHVCTAVEGQSAICSGGSCACVSCVDAVCPQGQCGDCYCVLLSGDRVQCAGVVFVKEEGTCGTDSDCADVALPGNLPPHTVRCLSNGACSLVFACGANI